ncbi:hypothetical protein TorRG33x02_325490 [Trema orientale]|uniref:Secreted protein n=1 Tax=Trema orientale TaxID=63057 RepID=A0A2P5BCX5_TREOI|nr:hypothetical protein TorRG33x02_325490 [Trema orientale]
MMMLQIQIFLEVLVSAAIVCCSGFQLVFFSTSSSSRHGNRGMEVRLGQSSTTNLERRGNAVSSIFSVASFHHRSSFGKFVSLSSSRYGKIDLDSILNVFPDMYSRFVNLSSISTLRRGK